MNNMQCMANTTKNTQCKHYKKNANDMFCTLHKQNAWIPKKTYFMGLKLNNLRMDEYEYLLTKFKINDNINEQLIKETLKEYNNQLEFNKRIEEEERKMSENKKINEDCTCKCCYLDDFDDNCLIRCNKISSEKCHKVCIECFINHLEIQLKENNVSLNCMFNSSDKCGGTYDIEFIRMLLEPEKFEKYYDYYLMIEVKELAKTIDNYQICPHCLKYGTEVNINNNEKIDIKCLRCNNSWCNLCKKKSHQNHCYTLDFDNIKEQDKIIIIDNIINDIKSRKLIHICPYCSSSFIKIDGEGCNLMTCTSCKGNSCYICGCKIPTKNNSHYYHFAGHALNDGTTNCLLWNNSVGENNTSGNRRYNEKQIILEFDKLLEVNKLHERKIIFNRIKKSYDDNLSNEIIQLGKKYKLIESSCTIL